MSVRRQHATHGVLATICFFSLKQLQFFSHGQC
jgi:hypothetical protein